MVYLGKKIKNLNKNLSHKEHNCDQCNYYGRFVTLFAIIPFC